MGGTAAQTTRQRTRGKRADAGLIRTTERDLRLLRIVGEQYALSVPQLARLMGRSEHAGRWLRERWQRAGWVEGRALLVGHPPFLWLTRRGLSAAGLGYAVWRPTPGALAHIAAVTQVRLDVGRRHPDAEWVSERDLAKVGSGSAAHRPDGLVVTARGAVAVEVELTQKERRRAARIMRELIAAHQSVTYFAAEGPRRQLEALAQEIGGGRVQVLPLPGGAGAMKERHQDNNSEFWGIAIGGAVALILSAPACVAAFALGRVLRERREWLFGATLLGAGVTMLMWGPIFTQFARAGDAIVQSEGILFDPQGALEAVWPHMRTWWFQTIGLAPALALATEAVRPKSVGEQLRSREEGEVRRRERKESRARRSLGIEEPDRRPQGFELGRHISGDRLLPLRRGRTQMPLHRLQKTTLVVGSPGSGKTETLLRLAQGAATSGEWSVFVIDAKGDAQTMERFEQLMRGAGRTPLLFPEQGYDGWRGTGREIANRLVELIDWAEEGGGTYYRDLSVNLVRIACTAPQGPPRSSGELLARLDRDALCELWAGTDRARAPLAFKEDQVSACRQRYQAFFDAVEGQLDGSFAFEDADCGYLLLNELIYGEETTKLARFLLEDFKHYVATRKQQGRQVLLIIDEFSAIASGERVARLVEIVRSYGASLVLAPQAYEGMGGPEAAARILNAAHTILLHSVPEPEALIRAAGTRIEIEASVQHDQGRSLELGSAREQHQHKVSPNEVRQLRPGMCFVIGSGMAQKVQVAPASSGLGEAPPPMPKSPSADGRHSKRRDESEQAVRL